MVAEGLVRGAGERDDRRRSRARPRRAARRRPGLRVRILVTGASGMAGRNFAEHERARHHELLQPGHAQLDLLDYLRVEAFLLKERPDIVLHLAGRVGGIQANIDAPVSFLVENWDMGRNLLMAAARCGVRRVLNVGSSCMYPKDWPAALEESMLLAGPLEPTNEGYALAKISVARLASYLAREDASRLYKTVIPCNLYGRHDRFDAKSSHLVAAAILKAHRAKREGRAAIEVWGDGQARREFLFAGDFADFLWRALESFDSLPELLNVGPGTDHTVSEYYRAALAAVGCGAALAYDTTRPVGMRRKLVSVLRLEKWGWRARTTIEEGMRRTYDFFLERHGR
ncbi:MAG: NAD-dependent epimerase/dehydratase family protein [Burkholderiales bacterium]|nr:NAD-dependent epimerase/dehydratase family protein [Burkholderiales bacterium]